MIEAKEAKKIGFGHGLPSILGNTAEIEASSDVSQEVLLNIPLDQIEPNKRQPRQIFDNASLNELALSVQSQGVIQPIIVRKIASHRYEIVAGERRWRAARIAGLKMIPSLVKSFDDKAMLPVSIIENIQREDINIIDEANAIKRLIEEFSFTQEEIAKMLGKARPTIANTLRLLNLSSEVKKMLAAGLLEVGHAKLLLGLEEIEQLKVAEVIIRRRLTVRQTENYIATLNEEPIRESVVDPLFELKIQQWQEQLSTHLHSKVDLKLDREGKGSVIIKVASRQEIEWLVGKLKSC